MTQSITELLESHGLSANSIETAAGFANRVWLTPDHVVRINDGRFVDAFAHESKILSHLSGILPVPTVVATGLTGDGGEFIILERLPGENLQDTWVNLTLPERNTVIEELGAILSRIHDIPLAPWMRNPSFEAALVQGDARNAYHAPPSAAAMLVASARNVRADLTGKLAEVEAFIDQRLALFVDDRQVFVHADMHFRNILVHQGHISGIIDFEGARPASIDVELDILIRLMIDRLPLDHAGNADILQCLAHSYPVLFGNRDLSSRLEVYELLWHLVQVHHWRPGATWMSDPAGYLGKVLNGTFQAKLARILPRNTEAG